MSKKWAVVAINLLLLSQSMFTCYFDCATRLSGFFVCGARILSVETVLWAVWASQRLLGWGRLGGGYKNMLAVSQHIFISLTIFYKKIAW